MRDWAILCIPFLFLSLLPSLVTSQLYTVYYHESTSSYSMIQGIDAEQGACWGMYDASDSMNKTGWAPLVIETSNKFSDEIQKTAAGFLEGATSYEQIYALHEMFNSLYSNNSKLNLEVTQWFENHITWLEGMVDTYKSSPTPTDPFWELASQLLAQLRGLVAGYNKFAGPGQGLSFTQLFMLNSGGDLMDVMMSIMPSVRTELFLDHCSALVLPLYEDNKLIDVFTGHTTWNQYNSMLRIFKTYDYNISEPRLDKKRTTTFPVPDPNNFIQTFSSYPSFLFSGDDYYLTSRGLAVMETTFTIFNNDLYKYVKPDGGVLTWMRATIANQLASSGAEWTQIFQRYNSGTYNNQWIIVDYKLVNSTLQNDLLWVVEQIPGSTQSADVTSVLRNQGYWPSYNIPYFETLYNQSGYAAMAAQSGVQYVYNQSARANIFRRDHSKVENIEDMKALMQYNDWQNDPLSLGDPSLSISSRFDLLNGTNAQLTGGIDSKVTSVDLFRDALFWGISGPTHQQQPAFSWQDWESNPHNGQPDIFNFKWTMLPW